MIAAEILNNKEGYIVFDHHSSILLTFGSQVVRPWHIYDFQVVIEK